MAPHLEYHNEGILKSMNIKKPMSGFAHVSHQIFFFLSSVYYLSQHNMCTYVCTCFIYMYITCTCVYAYTSVQRNELKFMNLSTR